MSTYIKEGKPLEFDNAPDWLVNYMFYLRTILNRTPTTTMTYFKDLRGFFQWLKSYKELGSQPKSQKELQEVDILGLPLSWAVEVQHSDIITYLHFAANILGNGETTRSKKLAALDSFYEYLIDNRSDLEISIKENPCGRIKRPKLPKKQPKFLTLQDQVTLLESISGKQDSRDYAIILTFLSTGIRLSEMCRLDMEDLNLKARTLKIRGGKGDKDRIACLTQPCCDAIQRYIEESRSAITGLDTKAIYVSQQKKRMTPKTVENMINKRFMAAGLGGVGYTVHTLRHTTATTMAKSGAGLLEIQMVLGHQSPVTTEIYTHLDDSDVARAVNTSALSKLGLNPQIIINELDGNTGR